MHARAIIALAVALICTAPPASAAVNINLSRPAVTPTAEGERVEQTMLIANSVANYELTYTAEHSADGSRILSDSWGWTQGYVPLGMTGPSKPNWYYQGFFNWQFDDESIHLRPAKVRVVRESGDDAMVEYAWETDNASVTIRFAMVEGSDKLLVFGEYEPKAPIERSFLRFVCYPAFFPEPRGRTVTTTLGTRGVGEVVRVDLERERWLLYEDGTRPGEGSAGMIIGTPDAFSSIEAPAGGYGIVTTLELKPEARRFALALYDFPTMPDYLQTREYFGRLGDREAEALEQMAAGDLDSPLPSLPTDEARVATVMAAGQELMNRPEERWRPDPEPLEFPWAAQLPGEPISTAVFVRRYEAWEAMELARRLEMDVQHLYWDSETALSNPSSWPYASATGVGAIPFGTAARRAAALSSDPETELFIIAGLQSSGVTGVARDEIVERIAEGAGLLLVGPRSWQDAWPPELLASEAPELAAQVIAGFDPSALAGLDEGEPRPVVSAWEFGAGRVVNVDVSLGAFSSLMPNHRLSEGILEAMDRWLGLCARAAAVAAGRPLPASITFGEQTAAALSVMVDGAPQGATLRARIQDDLGRTLIERDLPLPLGGNALPLPALPPSRRCTADLLVLDTGGNALGMASTPLEPPRGPRLASLDLSPASRSHELVPPLVDLPEGGRVECMASVDAPQRLDGAALTWEVRDVFDRLLATGTDAVPAGGGEVRAEFELPAPVTVSHLLDVTLTRGPEVLDSRRLRFTMTVPYPYDDFTALMWNTATTSPLMLHTDRLCYEWGTSMCDPANTLRADDPTAALMYDLRSRSGMRLVPYVSRIFAENPVDNVRNPSLSDPDYLSQWTAWLTTQGRQAAPYQPAAYTLGDENMLTRGPGEVGWHPAAIAEFREWLQAKYGTIAELNRVWETHYQAFGEIEPTLLEQIAQRFQFDAADRSLAPWIDHKVFLDSSFANTHNYFRDVIREQDPDAKVGWDGIMGDSWKSGYDLVKLTEECDLNQTYISRWLQGRLVEDFKRPDALTGRWGNRVADNEAGWHAFPWACLMSGNNSVWWWTSWGCDYIPFYPDLSQSNYGRWFFEAVRETTSGPGRMIVHAERAPSPIAVLYSRRNMFAAAIHGQMAPDQPLAGDIAFHQEHEDLLKAICDLGYEPTHISEVRLAAGIIPDDHRVLVLPLAVCLSDEEVASLREYVQAGGTLVVDGRAAILTGDGALRTSRPLDEVLGVSSRPASEAFAAGSATAEIALGALVTDWLAEPMEIAPFTAPILEPDLQVTNGVALAQAGGAPLLVANRFGDGMAWTLNFGMNGYPAERSEPGQKPRLEILNAILRGAGVEPLSEITLQDGSRPLATHQFGFRDGGARYLCVQQDILLPALADQQARIRLPEPALVYDVRAGRRAGEGLVQEWDLTLSRGYPLVYALLPYEVTGVTIEADAAQRGTNAEVTTAVQAADNAPGYHVVRVDVYAPGSDQPHRQYSRNVDCPGGPGRMTIPFALSDAAGTWRLIARDAATGTTAETTVEVR